MANLLHVDTSITGDDSVSRAVAREYVAAWRERDPAGTVTYRDLAAAPPPHLDWVAFSAPTTTRERRTPEQTEAVKIRELYIHELATAGELLLTVPMHNWSVPSTLKAWFDQVMVVGQTIMTEDGIGPLTGTKVTVVTTQGGSYGPGTPKEGWDHVSPYVSHVLAALGAADVVLINVEMTSSTINPALAQFTELFRSSRASAEQALRARAAA
ncbi:NAD(P)H-dependent oxidoreductase [Frankia sp. CNm7]|uniref:FMN dependent NADH:quinone oxidoreductase n=1 Tax=Frankia nepalensis TaxID=1836974 RepID=A0A937RG27_9ACTN|nr:NAD(P)H-dependent oxidoreductase [Frankia nepalensis]MBL7501217.1 NAD(P)H-dependent oxidoreductase [Frankia nepalensis]MBL7513508.1 NAD(P)H-dependent oxidoreductase [Frankia nepalensis]MBL7524136.1 NAD(P)H-dependent oxidoreductase [Frankia nepalensis]MBL7628219.1 NAD(P)H-dependent oxidoreductase [Frankia nepalensis]